MNQSDVIRSTRASRDDRDRMAEGDVRYERAAVLARTLLVPAPPPHVALAAAVVGAEDVTTAPLVVPLLAPHLEAALAAWRRDPAWAHAVIGQHAARTMHRGVARMVGAFLERPDVLHDAVAVALRNGDSSDIAACLLALGADGWRVLDAAHRAALLARSACAARGVVWEALTDAQRAACIDDACTHPSDAARLIGQIGESVWRRADPSERERLLNAAVTAPLHDVIHVAPAWNGMTVDEQTLVIRTMARRPSAGCALAFLTAIGDVGRLQMAKERRAIFDAIIAPHRLWGALRLRVADNGWCALTTAERESVLSAIAKHPARGADMLRVVGRHGWTTLSFDERKRIAAGVRRDPGALFRCPPSLWRHLAGADLPPVRACPHDAPLAWDDNDDVDDLDDLPLTHHMLVLARTPWRASTRSAAAQRLLRLHCVWIATPAALFDDLTDAHPLTFVSLAVAIRQCGDSNDATRFAASLRRTTATTAHPADAARRPRRR